MKFYSIWSKRLDCYSIVINDDDSCGLSEKISVWLWKIGEVFMMKIVVAIDSLKGSLTSIQAGEAIEKGIKKVDLEAEVVIKPLADGGEGTVDALVDGMGGKLVLGFSGAVTKEATACNEAGIDAYFPIVRSAVSLEDAMKKKNAQENLIDTVEQVFRLIKVLK